MRTDHRAPGRSGRTHRRRGGLAVALAVALALVACGSDGAGTQPEANTASEPPAIPASIDGAEEFVDPSLLEPLVGLGPCTIEPNTIERTDIDGLQLPDEAVFTEVSEDGPLTTVKGYVEMTPVQVRAWYQLRAEELQILQVEDEIRESEVLVGDGGNRLYVKTQAICEQGSVVLAVVAPEASSDAVPGPAGDGTVSGS